MIKAGKVIRLKIPKTVREPSIPAVYTEERYCRD